MAFDEIPDQQSPGEPPRQIGRYELLEPIGRGGMSEVFRARDTVLGRFVAIKMIATDLELAEETRERFFREARSAGQLAHRNIITIYDFGEDNGRAYIVMELLEGESLTRLMAREPDMPIERRIDIMMRVCEGLAYAHAHSIVHRDVKPANLFVTSDGQLKILDFGVARIAQSTLTAAGILVGTPDYMSPEQVEGRPVDQRSDVFSSGAVFYQLLSGRKPFEARRLPELLQKVATEDPPRLTELQSPAELSVIVMRALEKDATRRYQRIQDMLADLARVQQAFDRQTRALATRACDRYREIEQMLEDGAALASQLAVSVEPEQVAVAAMLRELPLFQDHGADVLRLVPMRRARVAEITRLLQRQYEALATRNAAWRNALTLVSTAEAQIRERDFAAARRTLGEALGAAPDSPRVQGLLEQCRFELNQPTPERAAGERSSGSAPTDPLPVQGTMAREPAAPGLSRSNRRKLAVTAAIDTGLSKPTEHSARDIDVDIRHGSKRFDSSRGDTSRDATSEPLQPSPASRRWVLIAGASALALVGVLIAQSFRSTPESHEATSPMSGDRPTAAIEVPAVLPEPQVAPVSPPGSEPSPAAVSEGKSDELVLPSPEGTASGSAPAAVVSTGGSGEGSFMAAGKRSGESIEAWRERSRLLTAQYRRGREALDRGQFTEALSIFSALDRDEPGFGDTPQLLRTARAGVRGQVQALLDQGTRQAASGEYSAAQASYADAERVAPGLEAVAAARTALRETIRKDADELIRRAAAEEGAGRTANAVGLYRRAVELLPAGDPSRVRAESRVRALQSPP